MLDFKFEEKLKKFVEENCNYSFEIVITKNSYGVLIDDYQEVRQAIEESCQYDLLDEIELLKDKVSKLEEDIEILEGQLGDK